MTTDHVNFLFIVNAIHLVSEIKIQLHEISNPPKLSLFRIQWRHRPSPFHSTTTEIEQHLHWSHNGSFVSTCKLFHAPSEITAACTYTPELKEEHLIAMSYQFLSFQHTRLNDSRSLPTGLPLSSGRAGTQSAHSCARQTSSRGPVNSIQAHFGSSANSL